MKKRLKALWLKLSNNRKLRCGGFSVALTAAVVVLVMLLSALFDGLEQRFALQMDFSFNGATTQGEITKSALAQLDKDVKIYAVVPASGGDEDLLSLLNRYGAASGHVTVTEENLLKNPVLQSQFTDAAGTRYVTDDCLIVHCPDTGLSRILTEDDYIYRSYNMETGYFDQTLVSYEKAVTEAILYVTQESVPIIQILSGHKELTQDETAFLEQNLTDANYQVVRVNLAAGDELNPEDPLMLLSLKYDLTEDELNQLMDFARAGGDFFVTAEYDDPMNLKNYNALLRAYGIEAYPGLVVAKEEDKESYYADYPVILMPSMQETDVTRPLISAGESILLVTEARAFRVSDMQPEGVMAYPLLITGEAYLRETANGDDTVEQQPGDPEGKFAVSVWSDQIFENGAVSHMFVLGDSNVFTDYWMQLNTSSTAFLLQVIRALQEKEPVSLDIILKPAQRESLTLGNITPAVIVIVMLPLLVLLGALLVLLPRKNL
ncbi:MAG: Gldg family protein [Clostridia bacterium]|nr:Gldg family protein [Clostridia bacterium]